MNRKQKIKFIRIIAAAVLFVVSLLVPTDGWLKLAICLIPYLVAGYDVIYNAASNIFRGQVFDEEFLMALASLGAFGIGEYHEAVFVMVFFQIGELFESIAVGKSRASVAALMDICPEHANIERDGQLIKVDPEDVSIGDIILVKPGERIPLDGCIIEGSSNLNTSALTGESKPRDVFPGDDVISGCINLSGMLKVKVSKVFADSTVTRILELVEESAANKSKSENFITRFARVYTPAVVAAAALLAVIPPIFIGEWAEWIHRALTFLVISCPCALVISVPMTYFGGVGNASRHGILVKGSNYLDTLSRCDTFVFDKTGTLTEGSFSVVEVSPTKGSAEDLLELAAHAEAMSDHPIAQSIRIAYGKTINTDALNAADELPGYGVSAMIQGQKVLAGNHRLLMDNGINCPPSDSIGTVVYIALDKEYIGCILIADRAKSASAAAIAEIKTQGDVRTVMLTGDEKRVAESIASELGIDLVYAELLPADKVSIVADIIENKNSRGALAFVGDGMNDAPSLSRADVGIAMGALGSDAAIEAADVVLMDDNPLKIPLAISIARKTRRIVAQNIVFSLAVKFGVLILGALGLAGMWAAAFADVGVCVIAVLNAMRTLK